MTAVAGDFYDFLETDAQRLGILVADASGHGVPAALIASMVKVALAAQRDGSADELEQNGLMLGFVEGTPYSEVDPLRPDDRFLLYTDGLIEAANAADELFGLDRLKATLAAAAGLQPHAATDALLTTVDTWSGQPPADDVTMLLVDWRPAVDG